MIFQSSMTFHDFSRNFFPGFPDPVGTLQFADDILNYILLTEKVCALIQITLKFIP